MPATLTHLVPIHELTPQSIGAIRNQVISTLVAKASHELNMPPESLLVRDIRPLEDLEMYATYDGTGTTNDWRFDVTSTAGFQAGNTDTITMADQRYVGLFGIRDLRWTIGSSDYESSTPENALKDSYQEMSRVSLVRISVGGSQRAIWDTRGLNAYKFEHTGFAPSAIIIPPNASYKVEWYVDRAIVGAAWLQLIGVVVEPRGKVFSP